MVRFEVSSSAAIASAVSGFRVRRSTWMIWNSRSARLIAVLFFTGWLAAADTTVAAGDGYSQAPVQEIGSAHMITLYGFGPGFGLPEISPFVTKTEVQLKMAGLAYRKERATPPASPKGQLPYIADEAESIADSTFIRAHIEGKYGFDFDAPLSLQDRAQAWAFERMI